MTNTVQRMTSLLFSLLRLESPVLSGNMKSMIEINKFEENEAKIVIDAPFYDMNRWKKEGVIVWTGEQRGTKTAYAEWVNKSGGFNTHNKSMFWINRACNEIANVIANEIGGIVINELEL